MTTATETMMRVDLRKHRARSLLAQFLNLVDPYLADDAQRDRLANDLGKLFYEEGVEILTDHDRAMMGLPPRGPDGWTAQELWALEKRRLDLMSQPISMTIPSPLS